MMSKVYVISSASTHDTDGHLPHMMQVVQISLGLSSFSSMTQCILLGKGPH